MANIRYAKGPVVYLYDLETRKKKRKQLLWGDWLRIGEDIDGDWSEVKWGRETLAIKKKDYQEERVLEMIFLDVGQGDGCILTTPLLGSKEKIMIIDAGIGHNMKGFLNYRFRDFKKKFKFHAAVVTHPDSDHYLGFKHVFEDEQISFKHVYHNGIMERTGKKQLGPVSNGFLTDIRASKTAAKALYSDAAVRGRKYYPDLIWTALTSDRFDDVSMLSTEHGQKEDGRTWMPGFAPSDNPEFTIEVLGPVVEKGPGNKKCLRTFASSMTAKAMNVGKTKNGHSVLLRLQYRDFSVLFGGDLNTPAEHFLMRHYGNDDEAPTTLAEASEMIDAAGARFRVDLMKCCHHGSSDVTDEFLEATEAVAFVVSSGDEESHVHPRPDLLGLLGTKGRGNRPLVLCTELLRSTREREDPKLRKKLDKVVDKLDAATNVEQKKKLREEYDELVDELMKRNVGVYGAINLRTDGRKAAIAFRNEKPSATRRWFYYELEKDHQGQFQLAEKGGH